MTRLPPITGPNGCGAGHPVRLEAVHVAGGRRVALQPPADLQCSMAEAVARWVRDDVAPALATGPSPLAAVITAASYDCRGRNRVKGAKLSEHGLANALDVRGFKLADGRTVALTDRAVAKALREHARETACSRFSTVLGPASDGYHEEHIHLDLIQRRSGFRMCQWAVHEPAPSAPVATAEPPGPSRQSALVPSKSVKPMAPPPRRADPGNPLTKGLPVVRRPLKPPFPLVERPSVVAVAAPPMPPSRPAGAGRPAACRAGHACTAAKESRKRRRARAPRRAVIRPFDELRAFFRGL